MTKLLLLGRPGCHLCEQMVEELLLGFPDVAWQIDEADVDSRADWQQRYGLKIPVLLDVDGTAVCVSRFDTEAVADWLRDRGRRSA